MVIKFQLTGQEHCQIKLIRALIINRRRRKKSAGERDQNAAEIIQKQTKSVGSGRETN